MGLYQDPYEWNLLTSEGFSIHPDYVAIILTILYIFRYFTFVPTGTSFPYATIKRKRNEKEHQRNVSLPAQQLIYIHIPQ